MKKLKKDIIVDELLFLIAQTSLDERKGNIVEIYYPLTKLSAHLKEKYGIEYSSQRHLYNQLKKFEKDTQITLFRRQTKGDDIYVQMREFQHFYQLRILNRSIKLLIANGALAFIEDILQRKKTILNVYLGDGSECYYIAQLFFEKIKENINIYTNNLGIIQLFHDYGGVLKNVSLYTRSGEVHTETYSVLDSPGKDYFFQVDFDLIFQSPRYVVDLDMLEVYEEIANFKHDVLQNAKGPKIIPLTLFEFFLPQERTYVYGKVNMSDYIITPSHKNFSSIYETFIMNLPVKLYKSNFAYDIYSVIKG